MAWRWGRSQGPHWSLSPVLLPCFVLGLTSFTVHGGRLVRTRASALYQAALCCAILLLCVAFFKSSSHYLHVALMYQALATMAGLFSRRVALHEVVARNLDYCANMTQVINHDNEKRVFRWLLFVVASFFVTIISSNAIFSHDVAVHRATIILLLLIRTSGLLLFAWATDLLLQQFKSVNTQLSSYLDPQPLTPRPVPDMRKEFPASCRTDHPVLSAPLVRQLRSLHCDLTQIARATNHAFNPLLVAILVALMLSIIFHTENLFSTVPLDVVSLVASIREVTILVLVIAPCHAISEVTERTAELVHDVLNMDDTEDGTRKELELFSVQLKNVRVNFSASGLFILNYAYLCSVAGMTATYVVILHQVRKKRERN